MRDDMRLGSSGIDHAALKRIADLYGNGDVPFLLRIQRRYGGAAADERAAVLFDLRERTLDTVEDVVEDTGTEQQIHARMGALDGIARHKTGGFLIALDRGVGGGNADDLAD